MVVYSRTTTQTLGSLQCRDGARRVSTTSRGRHGLHQAREAHRAVLGESPEGGGVQGRLPRRHSTITGRQKSTSARPLHRVPRYTSRRTVLLPLEKRPHISTRIDLSCTGTDCRKNSITALNCIRSLQLLVGCFAAILWIDLLTIQYIFLVYQ